MNLGYLGSQKYRCASGRSKEASRYFTTRQKEKGGVTKDNLGGPVSPEDPGVIRLVRLKCPTRSRSPTESVPFAHTTQVLERRKHKPYVGNTHGLSRAPLGVGREETSDTRKRVYHKKKNPFK